VTQFILRRLLVTIPVLFGIVFFVFALARIIPGDPCRAVLGEHATAEVCDAFTARTGLDQPIPAQFVIYLGQLAQGDLGTSLKHSRPVTEVLVERLPTTIELTILALTFAIVVGIPLGLISAVRRNSKTDVGTMVFANIGVSVIPGATALTRIPIGPSSLAADFTTSHPQNLGKFDARLAPALLENLEIRSIFRQRLSNCVVDDI